MTTLNNEKKSLVEGLFKHYKKDELTDPKSINTLMITVSKTHRG